MNVLCSYPHLQALEVFLVLNCRPVCRKTAASNIKTTKLVFFVTFSSVSAHHSLLSSYVTLIAITVIFYLSVTDVSRMLSCVLDNIQCVTVLVVIPGNIHHANCTGGLPCLAPDHTPALIITRHGRLRIIKITHHGKLQLLLRVIAASSDPSSNSNSQIPVPSVRPSSSELDLCFR